MRALLAAIATALIVVTVALPVVAGLSQAVLISTGELPGIGIPAGATSPWQSVLMRPGIAEAFSTTVLSGLGATLISLLLALGLAYSADRYARSLRWLIAPILAAPHAAIAIGFAFLIAPSGWLVRIVSPWPSGWTNPPDIATLGDSAGLALLAGLVVKELPFLLLVTLATLPQLPTRKLLQDSQTLGISKANTWIWIIVPLLYPRLRLSIFVALAFSLSVVDMGILLGPSIPPTLAVWATRLWNAPDPALWAEGAVLGLVLLGLISVAIFVWLLTEIAIGRIGHWLILRGHHGLIRGSLLTTSARFGGAAMVLAGLASLCVLLLWSVAGLWRFPEAWPSGLSFRHWQGDWGTAFANSLTLAGTSTILAVFVAILWLECEAATIRAWQRATDIIMFIPLLVPQIAFLPGLNIAYLRLGLDIPWLSVLLGHLVFVLPYTYLVLAGPWRRMDPRFIREASNLGIGAWRRLFWVRIPIMSGPLLSAMAVGFAVSVAQYLPTLLLGGGRVVTLTTEAVALSSGGDRRLAAMHGLLQATLPMLGFAFALLVPLLLWRKRALMH